MALDTTAPKTRRAILAGAIGGTAALAASALVRPLAAQAADGDPAVLGQWNQETSSTGFETATPGETAVQGIASATTAQGTGVYGEVASAEGGTGVVGKASATNGNATGVYGEASSPDGRGVYGSATSTAGGTGVLGEAAAAGGVGVFGSAAATSGDGVGVFGVTDAPEGAGVRAGASTTTGTAYGLWAESSSPHGTAVYGANSATSGSAGGVSGQSDSPDGTGVGGTGGKYGVWGDSSGTGVWGHSGELTGVLGFAGVIDMGVPAPDPQPKTGVFGISFLDATSVGVLGKTTVGKGVSGVATTGTGVYATSASGAALAVVGKAMFSRSKRVTIASGASSFKVTLAGVTTSSLVFANLQSNRAGYYVQAVVPTTGSFTIYLNKAVTSATYVAYFVVN